MSIFQPDLTQAQQYLYRLDRKGVFTLQTFCDKGNNSAQSRVFHGTLDQHADELIRLNLAGAGIFVMVNEGDGVVHDDSKTCRTNNNVVRIRAVFCDLDGAPIEPVMAHIYRPTLVVESSPNRYHAYWHIDGCPLAEFKSAQQRLASLFSGDKNVCDLPRVMRLPGFFHRKAEPFMTRIIFPE